MRKLLAVKNLKDRFPVCAHPEVVQKQDGRFQCSQCNKFFTLDEVQAMDRAVLMREVFKIHQFQSVN